MGGGPQVVGPGIQYRFTVGYSHLGSDPDAAKGSGGFVYAPATRPLAVVR